MAPAKRGTKRKAATPAAKTKAKKMTRDEAFHQEFYTDSDASEADYTSRGKLKQRTGQKPKRPQTPFPEAGPVSDTDPDDNDTEKGVALDSNRFVKLLFQTDGPQLNFNLADIIANSNVNFSELLRASGFKLVRADGRPMKVSGKYKGFVDLPVEVANMIYRELFVTDDGPILFRGPENYGLSVPQELRRSGQLLRTCRKIYEDGTAVLYGENAFHFARVHHLRGRYFENVFKEIGYKSARKWFHRIGPANVAKLKYVSIELEDALPSNVSETVATLTPDRVVRVIHDRRYANDGALIEILQTLAKHTRLEKLSLGFRGTNHLSQKDYHFLRVLCSIRCYEFLKHATPGPGRINRAMFLSIKGLVQLPQRTDVDPDKKKCVRRMYGTDESE